MATHNMATHNMATHNMATHNMAMHPADCEQFPASDTLTGMHFIAQPEVAEIGAHPHWMIHLTAEEGASLSSCFAQIPARGYQADPAAVTELDKYGCPKIAGTQVEEFEAISAEAVSKANPELIFKIRSLLHEHGVVVLRNIDYGATAPTNSTRCMHESSNPEAMIAGVNRLLGGNLVAYSEELTYSHPLFHDIRPTPQGREGSNGSGKEPMTMHMDMSYHSDRPDLLYLACIEEGPDKTVTTPFVRSKDLYDALSQDQIKLLSDPGNWVLTVPQSLGGDAVLMPVLEGTPENPVFNMRPHVGSMTARPGCPEAASALAHLVFLMDQMEQHTIHQQRGDLVIMDNLAVLHRRSTFTACLCNWNGCQGGKHRQLLRAYGKIGEVPGDRLYHHHGRVVVRSRL